MTESKQNSMKENAVRFSIFAEFPLKLILDGGIIILYANIK
ncbi:MAG TPA: hypothetical protein PKL50_03430 [bacterium]|nr:hypothetical protein [bacterium]